MNARSSGVSKAFELVLVIALTGCSGDEASGQSPGAKSDSGASHAGGTAAVDAGKGGSATGGVGGSGGGGTGGGGAAAQCSADADCVAMVPVTEPPGCAAGKCDVTTHKC